MSSLIVQVRTITNIRPHKNPEKTRIEIAEVDGWQCIVPIGQYKIGDNIVFIPPDAFLTQEVASYLGVEKYLKKGRVTSIRLDGEMSYGIIVKPEIDWPVGTDVTDHYRITKYEPPISSNKQGNGVQRTQDNPVYFHRFTDIENIKHFSTVLNDRIVVCLEKIHGANWRACLSDKNGTEEFLVGSRNTVRAAPTKRIRPTPKNRIHKFWLRLCDVFGIDTKIEVVDKDAMFKDWYWHPIANINECGNICKMMSYVKYEYSASNVTVFGETFGDGVQNMKYGKTSGQLGFVGFGITIDYAYLNYDETIEIFDKFNVPHPPVVYRGPYNFELIKTLSSGNSLISGANHIREGIVVQTLEGSYKYHQRLVFKCINDDYLLGKESGKVTDCKDD